MTGNDDNRLKRLAMQIASQLPDDIYDAIRVVEFVTNLLDWQEQTAAPRELRVVQ